MKATHKHTNLAMAIALALASMAAQAQQIGGAPVNETIQNFGLIVVNTPGAENQFDFQNITGGELQISGTGTLVNLPSRIIVGPTGNLRRVGAISNTGSVNLSDNAVLTNQSTFFNYFGTYTSTGNSRFVNEFQYYNEINATTTVGGSSSFINQGQYFNNQQDTTIFPAPLLNITDTAQFVNNGTLSNGGLLSPPDTSTVNIDANATFINNGQLINGNIVAHMSTLNNQGNFQGSAGSTISNHANLINAPTGILQVGTLENLNGGQVTNDNQITASSLLNRQGGSIVNKETGIITAVNLQNDLGGTLTNTGIITAANLQNNLGSTLTNNGTLNVYGQFDAQGNGTFGSINSRGTLINNGSINLSNQLPPGLFQSTSAPDSEIHNLSNSQTGGLYISVDPSFTGQQIHLRGTTNNAGGIGVLADGASLSIINHGILNNISGTDPISGLPTGVISVFGNVSFENAGTINNNSLFVSGTLVTNNTGATFTNNSNMFFNSGEFINSGTFDNRAGASVNLLGPNPGIYTQNGGTTINNGTMTQTTFVFNSGMISGNGTFIGTVFLGNDVTVSAGNSPGTLTFNGDFESEGDYLFEIAGTGDGQFDRIIINGNARFNGGTVDVEFLDGFMASVGDVFNFFTFGGPVTGLNTLTFNFSGLGSGLGFEFRNGQFVFVSAGGGGGGGNNPVPEPMSLALLAIGLMALTWARRRNDSFRGGVAH